MPCVQLPGPPALLPGSKDPCTEGTCPPRAQRPTLPAEGQTVTTSVHGVPASRPIRGASELAAGKPSPGDPRPLGLTGCLCLSGSAICVLRWERVGLSPPKSLLKKGFPRTEDDPSDSTGKAASLEPLPPPLSLGEQAALGTRQGRPPQPGTRVLPRSPRLTHTAQQLTDTATWFLTEINVHGTQWVYPAALGERLHSVFQWHIIKVASFVFRETPIAIWGLRHFRNPPKQSLQGDSAQNLQLTHRILPSQGCLLTSQPHYLGRK